MATPAYTSPPGMPPQTADLGVYWILDAVLVPFGVLLLVLYNVTFYFRVKFRPLQTVVGVNHINRRAWVLSVMKDIDKKNILAVQTLRNSIMASTLLASTAMLLAGAMAAFVASSSTNFALQTSVNSVVVGYHSPALVTLKFFCILLCFIFSFTCHVQAIRYTNHAGFLINIPLGPDVPGLTPEYVSNVVASGSNFYTIGTRGFYCAFPFLLWLFGPIPFVVSCIVMVPALYCLDTASGFDSALSKREDSTESSGRPGNGPVPGGSADCPSCNRPNCRVWGTTSLPCRVHETGSVGQVKGRIDQDAGDPEAGAPLRKRDTASSGSSRIIQEALDLD